MDEQIRKLLKRFAKVEELLGQADVLADQKQYRELAQEHSYLTEVKEYWQRCESLKKRLEENQQLLKTEKDPEFLEIVRQEIPSLEAEIASLRHKLETLLIPPILATVAISSWKFAPVPAATRLLFSSAIACACTSNMPTTRDGNTSCSLARNRRKAGLKNM